MIDLTYLVVLGWTFSCEPGDKLVIIKKERKLKYNYLIIDLRKKI